MEPPPMQAVINRTASTLAALASVVVALASFRYLPAIGPLIPQILANAFARPWLDVHVAGAATALLVGPFNLIGGLRRRRPVLHRWIGRTYIGACLIGGVGGLIIAFGSFAGPIATVGFGALAVCWLTANVQGWRTARARRFDDHRRWMIRSFAMTFGAVTLRLYLPLIPLLHIPFVEGYRAVSFLAWIPNLIAAEVWLRRRLSQARAGVGHGVDAPWRLSARAG